MTTEYIEIVARIYAHKEKRAVPIRATSALAPSPMPAFGIAPVRVVSEQRAQAIAYGLMGKAPDVVVSWHPLGRESAWLEPFAKALDDYLSLCSLQAKPPRIWVPHGSALEVVDLLGHRYRRNKKATDSLRCMGAQCRALGVEYTFAGQQVVVVASELLLAHAVTGQQPIEDRHLGALLAWFELEPDVDPADEADRRALESPAAAMLTRKEDDRVEHLRKIAKSRKPEAEDARSEIEAILRRGALREWDLLLRARRAFARIELPPDPELGHLMRASRERILYALQRDLSNPSQPHSLSRRLDTYEHAIEVLEDIEIRKDDIFNEKARQKGRVFFAEVVDVDQPISSRRPCTLTLHTFQDVLRIRPGQAFQTLDRRAQGRVLDVRNGEPGEGTFIILSLKHGVKKSTRPKLNSLEDWTDTVIIDTQYRKHQIYTAMGRDKHPLIYSTNLPPSAPRALSDKDLMAIADVLKRV